MSPTRDHVIYYYPTVIPSRKDSVNIFITDATDVLKCCSRFSVSVDTPENILEKIEKQLTVDHVSHTLTNTNHLFDIVLASDSSLLRCI